MSNPIDGIFNGGQPADTITANGRPTRQHGRPAARPRRSGWPAIPADPGNEVVLTETARKLRDAKRELENVPAVDDAKVEQVRKELALGTYRIDGNRIARKLIDIESQF